MNADRDPFAVTAGGSCRARPRIVPSDHCLKRFARRQFDGVADPQVMRDELDRVLNWTGRIVLQPPAWVVCARRNDAYLVCGPTVFPLARDRNAWVALTCLHKDRSTRRAPRRSRAELLLERLDAAGAR